MAPFNGARSKPWPSICVAHGVRCIADRSWKFFLPLYLSKSCGVRPTAAISLAQNLAVAVFSTFAANIYRKSEHSFGRFTILENVAMVVGGVLLSLFAASSENDEAYCHAPFQSPLFAVAVICGCVDAVCSSLLSNTISKEWVAALFQKKDGSEESSLASANARLSQIDLAVATVCPILVSFIIQRGGYKTVLILLVGQHVLGAIVILTCVQRALRLRPDLGRYSSPAIVSKRSKDSSSVVLNPFSIFTDTAVPTKAKLVTTAYILLYFTVLSPGSVLSAWLNSVGQHNPDLNVSENAIAWFGSSANLLGAFVTLFTPTLISILGTYKAGVATQYFQCACIMFATFCFNSVVKNGNVLIKGFLLPVAISRLGLWGFDLVERQILQESVHPERQTIFFNAERSLTQLVSLGMMYLCYVYSDPAFFGILVNLSALAVASSSVILGISMLVELKPLQQGKSAELQS